MDFQKSDNLLIRVEKNEYSGKEYYDFRTHYKDKEGEWKPSPKGFTIPLESIHDFTKELAKFFAAELKDD